MWAQKIDSLKIISNSSPPVIYVGGILTHTGFSLKSIETNERSDTIIFDIIFRECYGFGAMTPFDTLYSPDTSFLNFSYLKIRTIIDTNSLDTSMCPIRSNDTITDSILLSYPFNLHDFKIAKINTFPNPSEGVFCLEYDESQIRIEELTLFDIRGEEVPVFRNGECFSLKYPQKGMYLLWIVLESGIGVRHKLLIN